MAYIRADGSVTEKPTIWRMITDFFGEIFAFFVLFFGSISKPKKSLLSERKTTTYAERNRNPYRPTKSGGGSGSGGGAKRSNIRGVRDLGTADAKCGGGG